MQWVKTVSKGVHAQADSFFVSYRPPLKAVGVSTIARWVVTVMSKVGVNIEKFKAHSTRSVSTSAAKGLVPIDTILSSGG